MQSINICSVKVHTVVYTSLIPLEIIQISRTSFYSQYPTHNAEPALLHLHSLAQMGKIQALATYPVLIKGSLSFRKPGIRIGVILHWEALAFFSRIELLFYMDGCSIGGEAAEGLAKHDEVEQRVLLGQSSMKQVIKL
jgi:hypothetical protein